MSPSGAHPTHNGETESPVPPRVLLEEGSTTLLSIIPPVRARYAPSVARSAAARRPAEPSSFHSSEDVSYAGCEGLAELPVLAGIEVDAVYFAGDDDLGGIEKLAPVLLGEALVVPGELSGFLLRSLEHLRHVGERGDRGRGDQNHNGSAAIRPAPAP